MYATPLFATVNQYITHFDASLLRPQVFLVWNRGGLVAKMERRSADWGWVKHMGTYGLIIHSFAIYVENSALKYWRTEQIAIFWWNQADAQWNIILTYTYTCHRRVRHGERQEASLQFQEIRMKKSEPLGQLGPKLFPCRDDHVPSKGLEPSSQIFCWTPKNTGENPPLHQHAI